jgi:Flp pilus assembly protein TadD
MSRRTGAVLVFALAVLVYLNNLGNAFVYDDRFIIERNQAVQAPDWRLFLQSDSTAEKRLGRSDSCGDRGAMVNLGLSLYKTAHLEEALEVIEKAVELEPGRPGCLMTMGEVALEAGIQKARQGDWETATRFFQRSFRAQPGVDAGNRAGMAWALLEELDEAETWHRRALDLEPGNAPALNYLGVVEERRGRVTEARNLYLSSLSSDADYVPALLNLGSVFMNGGELEFAESRFRRASELAPDSYEAHNSLGIVLVRLGRHREAASAFRRAVSIDPELRAARENLAALEGRIP